MELSFKQNDTNSTDTSTTGETDVATMVIIIAGCVLGFFALAFTICMCCCKDKKKSKTEDDKEVKVEENLNNDGSAVPSPPKIFERGSQELKDATFDKSNTSERPFINEKKLDDGRKNYKESDTPSRKEEVEGINIKEIISFQYTRFESAFVFLVKSKCSLSRFFLIIDCHLFTSFIIIL